MNKCEYSYVPWFIFDDRLDYDPSNVIMVIITQATSEGSNYPAHQHSFVRVYFANEVRISHPAQVDGCGCAFEIYSG